MKVEFSADKAKIESENIARLGEILKHIESELKTIDVENFPELMEKTVDKFNMTSEELFLLTGTITLRQTKRTPEEQFEASGMMMLEVIKDLIPSLPIQLKEAIRKQKEDGDTTNGVVDRIFSRMKTDTPTEHIMDFRNTGITFDDKTSVNKEPSEAQIKKLMNQAQSDNDFDEYIRLRDELLSRKNK